MTINLPEELFTKIKAQAEKSGEFATPEEYILFVLEQLVADTTGEATPYSAEDEAKVKARLEGLGYLE
jgi:Arc/MetJ-type ribon-helix-helix transcriptional regulator